MERVSNLEIKAPPVLGIGVGIDEGFSVARVSASAKQALPVARTGVDWVFFAPPILGIGCLLEKVTKHFNDFVGKILEFKCPSSTDVWHVGLIGSGDKLVLQPGWSDFASSNNVSQNNLLLFKLVGGCTFEVRIFDPFGREKGGDFEGEADEDKVQEGTKIVQGRNGTSANPHPRKRSRIRQNSNSPPLKKWLKKSDYACVPRCWKVMSIEQKTRADRLAFQIQAGNPAFLHLIKQSKRPSTVIPKEFSAKHLQKRNQTFILRLIEKENSWPLKYYFRRDFTNTIEGKPFNKFIEENHLKERDVCVFELVTTADQISFIVRVSRAI
ncbi:B3 domain-containing protein [Carex littledalei]|uniref:B3 domain-containing protein n=1 Tax=Carex littledalei TaxID=544730 RepID=A0A833VXE0_9POAL|nr:B3 domain-containing protein [Carex littledalei]